MSISSNITHDAVVDQAEAFAPSNIALAKYWGKQNVSLKIPSNASLSISLDRLGTRCSICSGVSDQLQINGEAIASNSPIAKRVFDWIDMVCGNTRPRLYINTFSNIPMAAGVASSASAFAALTFALNRFFGWNFKADFLSSIARLGSASAARSIFKGFVKLVPQQSLQQFSCFAEPVGVHWREFRIAILTVSRETKEMSSTAGMAHTQKTSPLFSPWPKFADASFSEMLRAVQQKDIVKLGEAAEHNALTMHATMMAANPSLIYLRPESLQALLRVQQLRKQGIAVYATMDAGPNIKLIFLANQQRLISQTFTNIVIIDPFAVQ